MGYKILDVKADIHEDVEKYLNLQGHDELEWATVAKLQEGILDIVDEHFEKIER